MPCYHPWKAFQARDGGPVSTIERRQHERSLWLPCGQCVGCRLERSRQWAVRCMHETATQDLSAFVTLTYDEAFLPPLGSLDPSHLQLFFKRLRKHQAPAKIRYFAAGEYGEEGRPHYHAIIWGSSFPDYRQIAGAGDRALYASQTLTDLWGMGHVTVGQVTFESAAYVARYCVKKITGDLQWSHYAVYDSDTGEFLGYRTPEFSRMSLKPGIGAAWLDKFKCDVFPHGRVEVRGHFATAPRYYDKLYDQVDPGALSEVKAKRELVAYSRRSETTEERLAVREAVATARLNLKNRSLK